MKNLNNNLVNLLVGCLLADAHIGRSETDKAFITFELSIKHIEYILDLHQKNFFFSET